MPSFRVFMQIFLKQWVWLNYLVLKYSLLNLISLMALQSDNINIILNKKASDHYQPGVDIVAVVGGLTND